MPAGSGELEIWLMLTFPLAEFSAAQHCFPGASSESTGPFLSSSHCWPCSCQHFLLTPPGHLPGEWSEQKNPGMEAKRIWPFQCVHQANGQLVTIMGIHSRVSQWNQRPSFALKMGNIFIQHKPTVWLSLLHLFPWWTFQDSNYLSALCVHQTRGCSSLFLLQHR